MKDNYPELKKIINYIKCKRGVDFSGYHTPMIIRRLNKRLYATQSKNLTNYHQYLTQSFNEVDELLNVLTINVSHFFRNPLSFELLYTNILIDILQKKIKNNDTSFRIWSAGCSKGEEVYSIAILIKELLENEEQEMDVNIFATDIDLKALHHAKLGLYNADSLQNIKFAYLNKYFNQHEQTFELKEEVQKMVKFSKHDLLSKSSRVPPDSIFGEFDLVLCRNVIIYFEPDYQKIIFEKLYNALQNEGYLMLGEAETPIGIYRSKFKRFNKCCKIYKK